MATLLTYNTRMVNFFISDSATSNSFIYTNLCINERGGEGRGRGGVVKGMHC